MGIWLHKQRSYANAFATLQEPNLERHDDINPSSGGEGGM
jgi:hypothetical protein